MKNAACAVSVLPLLLLLPLLSCGVAEQNVELSYLENDSMKNQGFAQGVAEILQEFSRQNPRISVKMQSYPDMEILKRLEILAASNHFPDVLKFFSLPVFMDQYVARGDFLELDMERYKGNGYVVGSLESNRYGGKLYGIPDTADLWIIYYNRRLFDQAGQGVPGTFDDLLHAADAFNAKGIIPAVMNFKDGLGAVFLLDALIGRIDPDFTAIENAFSGKVAVPNSSYVEAARIVAGLVQRGVFPKNILNIDSTGARDLFCNQKAAMFVSGSWDMGIAFDQRFPPEFRDNVRAMKIPAVAGGKGSTDNLLAWFGGNHVVSAKTRHGKEALLFLDFISQNRARILWKNRATMPAQYMKAETGDHPLVAGLLGIVADARLVSGLPMGGRGGEAFGDAFRDLCVKLLAGSLGPVEYCVQLEASLKGVR